MKRLPASAWISIGSCALLGILSHLPPPYPHALGEVAAGVFVVLMVSGWFAMSALVRALRGRTRSPFTASALSLVIGLASIATAGLNGGLVGPRVSSERISASPFGILAFFGMILVVLSVFYLVADVLEALTGRARSVRTRVAAVGLVSGLFGGVLARLAQVTTGGGRVDFNLGPAAQVPASAPEAAGVSTVLEVAVLLIFSGIGAVVIWSFASVLAARLTRTLERQTAAMDAVAGGDLSLALEVQGRDEVARQALAFNQMLAGLRDREFVERAFGRYVTVEILEALRASGSLRISPARCEATVLFADVRGFTALSEAASPEEVVKLLDVYFEAMAAVVRSEGGYLNKFIGDAVMVVFGAPVAQADHAARAVRCALRMQEAIGRAAAEGKFGEREVRIGIGVNTGPLVAGTLGPEERAEYTVIGDTVNVASRLAGAAGPGEVVLGEATAAAAGTLPPHTGETLTVKGKSGTLGIRRFVAAA